MAPQNPEFVRLADYMTTGMHQDPATGWSITGMDVKPFPEDPAEQRVVRRLINSGMVEAAGTAEHEEAHPEEYEEKSEEEAEAARMVEIVQAAAGKKSGPVQEHKLRAKEQERAARVVAARVRATLEEQGIDPDEIAGLDADTLAGVADNERRAALVAEQEEDFEEPEDEEERLAQQQERTATRAPAGTKKTEPSKKAKKKKASASS